MPKLGGLLGLAGSTAKPGITDTIMLHESRHTAFMPMQMTPAKSSKGNTTITATAQENNVLIMTFIATLLNRIGW